MFLSILFCVLYLVALRAGVKIYQEIGDGTLDKALETYPYDARFLIGLAFVAAPVLTLVGAFGALYHFVGAFQ